jgi:hypothetical protein
MCRSRELVTTLDDDNGWTGLVTCYECAEGDAADVSSRADATMGCSLARLHQSMRRIGQKALPLVAALDACWGGLGWANAAPAR